MCRSFVDRIGTEIHALLLAKISTKMEIIEYADELVSAVVAISRQFAVQKTSLEFDALFFLQTLSGPTMNAL
jgi:hypothetical protein